MEQRNVRDGISTFYEAGGKIAERGAQWTMIRNNRWTRTESIYNRRWCTQRGGSYGLNASSRCIGVSAIMDTAFFSLCQIHIIRGLCRSFLVMPSRLCLCLFSAVSQRILARQRLAVSPFWFRSRALSEASTLSSIGHFPFPSSLFPVSSPRYARIRVFNADDWVEPLPLFCYNHATRFLPLTP